MSDSKVIREVLIQKFEESRNSFNETIYNFLPDSRKWVEEALLFKLPNEVKRNNIKNWKLEGVYELDSITRCNFNLDEKVVAKLLEIQPLDFWCFFLQMPIYEIYINRLDTIKKFESFLNAFTRPSFPRYEWSEFKGYTDLIFSKVKSEDVISKLKECQFEMYLVEKTSNNQIQLNMMNIILYSMIFQLNHQELAILCAIICNIIVFIETGRDSDKESSDALTMRNWVGNGNWGRVINYYLHKAALDSKQLGVNLDLKKCLETLINNEGFVIFPFQFRIGSLEKLINSRNELMREQINNLRKNHNSNALISLNS
jgi:hypothetical protein